MILLFSLRHIFNGMDRKDQVCSRDAAFCAAEAPLGGARAAWGRAAAADSCRCCAELYELQYPVKNRSFALSLYCAIKVKIIKKHHDWTLSKSPSVHSDQCLRGLQTLTPGVNAEFSSVQSILITRGFKMKNEAAPLFIRVCVCVCARASARGWVSARVICAF